MYSLDLAEYEELQYKVKWKLLTSIDVARKLEKAGVEEVKILLNKKFREQG